MAARLRGFGSMNKEKQREIASMGGKAAHVKGTAHQFTSDEARAAGKKGGKANHAKGTAHRFTSEEAKVARAKRGEVRTHIVQGHQIKSFINQPGGTSEQTVQDGPQEEGCESHDGTAQS